MCLATIQHHSTTALSTQLAPSLGMALKQELEAGGRVLEGGWNQQRAIVDAVGGKCLLGVGKALCMQLVNWCLVHAGPGSR